MKNKFIAGLLALAMLCTLNTSVVKADNEFTETGNQSVPVTCDITATFTVRLPASIPLTKNTSKYDYNGNVGVKGDLPSGARISVTPASEVKLYDMTLRPSDPLPSGDEGADAQHKASQTANVTMADKVWTTLTSDYVDHAFTVATDGLLEAATWKGSLPFDIEYNAGSPTP